MVLKTRLFRVILKKECKGPNLYRFPALLNIIASLLYGFFASDEITLIIPQNKDSEWGAIENVLHKASEINNEAKEIPIIDKAKLKEKRITTIEEDDEDENDKKPSAVERLEKEIEEERKKKSKNNEVEIMDEWIPNLEEIKKETSHPVGVAEK